MNTLIWTNFDLQVALSIPKAIIFIWLIGLHDSFDTCSGGEDGNKLHWFGITSYINNNV